MSSEHELVVILDFGGQYTQLSLVGFASLGCTQKFFRSILQLKRFDTKIPKESFSPEGPPPFMKLERLIPTRTFFKSAFPCSEYVMASS